MTVWLTVGIRWLVVGSWRSVVGSLAVWQLVVGGRWLAVGVRRIAVGGWWLPGGGSGWRLAEESWQLMVGGWT